MARKKKAPRKGYSVGLDTPGIEMFPPRTIACSVCGETEEITIPMPLFGIESIKAFNELVEKFKDAHVECFVEE